MSQFEKEQFETQLLSCFNSVVAHLSHHYPELHRHWQTITSALLYPLEAGGKRVRPTALALMAQACGAPLEHPAVGQAACAVELIHTYSLVHDDLPCMDNDDFRRGQPTTHKVYGDAYALLVGDALLTHAFHILSHLSSLGLPAEASLRCVRLLSQHSGPQGMIAGQWLDLTFEKSVASADWQALSTIHNLKTGALLAAAFSIGLVVGCAASEHTPLRNATEPEMNSFTASCESIGFKLGLAFQIVDDVLDATQSSNTLGKTAGKDSSQDKLTAVKLLGTAGATARAEELTHECLAELTALEEKILALCPHEQSSKHFQNLRSFIRQLLLRTS